MNREESPSKIVVIDRSKTRVYREDKIENQLIDRDDDVGRPDKEFKCEHCKFETNSKKGLNIHRTRMHKAKISDQVNTDNIIENGKKEEDNLSELEIMKNLEKQEKLPNTLTFKQKTITVRSTIDSYFTTKTKTKSKISED